MANAISNTRFFAYAKEPYLRAHAHTHTFSLSHTHTQRNPMFEPTHTRTLSLSHTRTHKGTLCSSQRTLSSRHTHAHFLYLTHTHTQRDPMFESKAPIHTYTCTARTHTHRTIHRNKHTSICAHTTHILERPKSTQQNKKMNAQVSGVGMLQCIVVCVVGRCSMFLCVPVCCRVLPCIAV